MKTLVLSLVATAGISATAFAAPKVLVHGDFHDSACVASASNLLQRYGDLFDIGDVTSMEINSFENTTRGSFNQEYEAIVALREPDQSQGIRQLKFTFSSPFICDDLKILAVESLPNDTDTDLFKCLNSKSVEQLEAAESAARDQLHKAHEAACADVPFGEAKGKCFQKYNEGEGKAVFDAVIAASDARQAAMDSCYAK